LLEQAQAADRAKSRFLATVSHELRTPLTALAGYEELLVDQVIGPLSDSQLDVLERMRSVTQHLASVIEELLAFSSLDEGRETVRPTDFLAADLVRATVAVVEPLARQKHLSFRVSIPDEPIRMTSDVDKVRQILVNLAGNAVKFTDQGEVRLELGRRDSDVRFVVRDTGMGIPRRDLDRLFRPFAQLDTGLTRRHGGTGLGLYISRSLAELLGGRIAVESEVGKGSAFSLILPAD
jgi:signal transduction histidine kinase